MDDRTRGVLLSVVIPAFNEASTVEEAILRVRSVPIRCEVIAVDDGSTDGTREILVRLEAEGSIDRLVLHSRNRGKGAAVRSGIGHATGELIVIHDADLEYDPHDLPRLMQPLLDGRADAVYGSRFLGAERRVLYFWHRVGNGVVTLLSNMLTNVNLTDMETCYKMVRADLLKSLPLRCDRFGIEPELTALLARSRARIYEVPVRYDGRRYAEGKKIRWTDGVAALWHIVRSNLTGPPVRPYAPAAAGTGAEAPRVVAGRG